MRNTGRRIGRWAAVAIGFAALAGCAPLQEAGVFEPQFWEKSPAKENTLAELGLAELAKGNHLEAEHQFQQALKKDARDVYALTGLGIIYQNSGQQVKAREMYEAVLAIRPGREEQFIPWTTTQTRPIIEVASVNLAMLESGGTVGQMAVGAAVDGGVMAAGSPAPAIKSAPTAMATLGRPNGAGGPDAPPEAVSKADAAVIARFSTLAALRDQGLITPQEYAQRRQANVGALLPLTSPPAAAGLDRAVPATDQVSGRLRAIGRALEMRALTVAQHAAERNMILDALMPAAPVNVANPGAPPQGLMAAADAVRRLEQLKTAGLISSDEYTKERTAIERAMQPAGSAAAGGRAATAAPDAPAGTAGKAGVHLASFRSDEEAQRGWTQIKRAHQALLGNLQPEYAKINLGPGKGVYVRIKAGPLNSREAAADLCRKLKARKQYCEPTFMGEG